MEMLLFLNESYIFHRFRMWSIVLWHSCVFVCAECGNANYRGAGRCLEKPFCAPVKFPFSVKKNIRILDLDPRTEVYCLSLNSVCSKRLPRKKCFYLLKSVQDIRHVLGVVYCWGLQTCELSANTLVQLRNCSR
ncbi:BBT_collapsed_G0018190.mRNA.1.CDS.1 [Saccharomyces cerevisiae]|nr:BBT_collapsed_G0018190.mRNA.1.CDS.1 [Saccharomyces cerevisiae]